MALIALVIGTSVTVAATERVDFSLLVAGSFGWSFVPVLQLMTGLLLIARTNRLPRRRALEAYFALHWPWSLWMLSAAVLLLVLPPVRDYSFALILTSLVAMVWTIFLLIGFCREQLAMTTHQARWRVALHQVVTIGVAILYVSYAVALWPRVVSLFT